MRCINSPPVLNSLEGKIVESIPASAKHVLVVNAGDGRLARAIREKLDDEAAVSVVTLWAEMLGCVDDFGGAANDPWDMSWHEVQVAARGPFDCLVFYQLHEFWRGELWQFQRILKLAAPGAAVWLSFVNAQARRLTARFVPPLRLGFSALADPLRSCTNIDFASVTDFVGQSRGTLIELWAMLDQDAQDFCHQQPPKPTEWPMLGAKVKIGTLADAFLWGGSVVGMQFTLPGGPARSSAPKVSFSPYSAALLQALVLPYPDVQAREGLMAEAEIEIAAWQKAPRQEIGPVARFFLSQVADASKPKRVLLLGSGWGRDLLLLKHSFPAWDWVGFDHRAEVVALGRDLVAGAALTSLTAELDQPIPVEDDAFDLAVSLGYFSTLFEPAARRLAKQVLRVTREASYYLEDGRGPDHGMHLKSYPLKAVYSELGADSTVQPVLVDGSPIGMYMLKVVSPA